MRYEYVRKAYGVSPTIGHRVQHQVTGKSGVIRREDRSAAHYVMVLFDGGKFALPCHPTELDYLGEGSASK